MLLVLMVACAAPGGYTVENKMPVNFASVAPATATIVGTTEPICTVDAYGFQTCSQPLAQTRTTVRTNSVTHFASPGMVEQPVRFTRSQPVRDWVASRPRLFTGKFLSMFSVCK